MEFKEWLNLTEMPHFRVDDKISLKGKDVEIIDMKFELYPKNSPAHHIGAFDKFIAKIPNSDKYLLHNRKKIKTITSQEAIERNFLPHEDKPYSISEKGYMLLPDNWHFYASMLDKDYNLI